MASSAIKTAAVQLKAGNIQNQADTSAVYSDGEWSFKNSSAVARVTIKDDGSVGIGTSSPSSKFEVKDSSTNCTGTVTSANSSIQLQSNATDGYVNMIGAGSLVFRSGLTVTEKMRIDASGNLLVGKDTPENSKVYISKTTSSGGWSNQALTLENIGSTAPGIGFHHPQASNAAVFKFWGPASQFECLNLSETGYVNIKALTCIDASDYRLKEEVQPLASGLEKALKLKPCYFTWKTNKEKNLGFIAHELQEVIPEAVFGEKDAMREDGTAEYQGMSSNAVIAVLTAAIQELSAKNDALEARLAALEAK